MCWEMLRAIDLPFRLAVLLVLILCVSNIYQSMGADPTWKEQRCLGPTILGCRGCSSGARLLGALN